MWSLATSSPTKLLGWWGLKEEAEQERGEKNSLKKVF